MIWIIMAFFCGVFVGVFAVGLCRSASRQLRYTLDTAPTGEIDARCREPRVVKR